MNSRRSKWLSEGAITMSQSEVMNETLNMMNLTTYGGTAHRVGYRPAALGMTNEGFTTEGGASIRTTMRHRFYLFIRGQLSSLSHPCFDLVVVSFVFPLEPVHL